MRRLDYIKFNEISVVIQGPIYNTINEKTNMAWTQMSCYSVRQKLPGAEIVLSTWEGSTVDSISFDKIVFCKDPGPVYGSACSHMRKETNIPLNTNRQIVTTQQGIQNAKNKYILKIRSDMVIENLNFLALYEKYAKNSDHDRIMMLNSHAPSNICGYTLCINDFLQFGLKDSVEALWDLPKYNASILVENKIEWKNLVPEEYIMINYINKKNPVYTFYDLTHCNHNAKMHNVFKSILGRDFIIIDTPGSGAVCLKYPVRNTFFEVYLKHSDFSHIDWLNFYYTNMGKVYNCYKLMSIFSWITGELIYLMKVILRRGEI